MERSCWHATVGSCRAICSAASVASSPDRGAFPHRQGAGTLACLKWSPSPSSPAPASPQGILARTSTEIDHSLCRFAPLAAKRAGVRHACLHAEPGCGRSGGGNSLLQAGRIDSVAIPVQGSVVHCRSHRWLVDLVEPAEHPEGDTVVAAGLSGRRRQRLEVFCQGPLRDWLGDEGKQALLILDEAHNAAPASGSKFAIDSKLTRAIRDLAWRFEHKLFLRPRSTTATATASRRCWRPSIQAASAAAWRCAKPTWGT